ncbi:MAG: Ig-like domain-containing protein, partial [Phycisphaerales bacterium]
MQAEAIAAPLVVAANTVQGAPLPAAAASATTSPETYQVVVKAPQGSGMLAYLVGPGAEIVLKDIDLNQATLTQEGGNLRITLPGGAEVLLLDYVASAKDSSTTITTAEGHLPAQKLLEALNGTDVANGKNLADIQPAAGPASGGEGGGGIIAPTILGLGVGEGEGVFSSVIGPYALPRPYDRITTEEYPVNPGPDSAKPTPPANLPPFAHNDAFSTAINKPLTLNPGQLLVNDTDPENDALTITSVQGALHGTVAIVGGQVVFTPETGFTGTGSFSYTITDGHGNTSTADVIIQIDPTFPGQNTVIAADDAYTVPEAGRSITMSVLGNDSDPEGDALVPGSVRILSGPDKGTATVNADGTISYVSVGRDAYFTTLVYEVSDARGARDTATVTIEVKAATNNVDAIDDTGEIIPAGATKTFNVTANDVDPQGDSFQITSIVQPAVGTATFNAATGTITYQSVASNTGYDATIVYEITDSRGATDTATLTVRVEPTNNVSAVDDTADLRAGQDVRIDVLRNDFDQQGDTFKVTRIIEQPHVDGGAARGSVTINADGSITYTDTPGARDSAVVEFKYEIEDSRGALDIAVVRVTIGAAANGVDANNDTLAMTENDPRTNVTSQLLANDFDPQGDSFKITAIGTVPAAQGTLELVGNQVFFTPANGYHGPVTFTYTITDALGAQDTAQVTIDVNHVNQGLNAGDDTFTTPFNTNLTITPAQLLVNDNDPDGSVLNASSIISYTQPLNGTVTLDGNGNFIYNPADTFRGTDSFTYTIRDGQG